MNRMYDTLTRTMTRALDRLQRRFRRARPGSVLIMVVALLVLLALMGTAYLATARNDRLAGSAMRDSGLQVTVKQAAQDAISQAVGWIAADGNTFTSYAVDGRMNQPNGADGTSYLAPRQPQWFGLNDSKVPFDNSKGTPYMQGPPSVVIGWPRLTNPAGFKGSLFRSPALMVGNPKTNNSFVRYTRDSYDMDATDVWALPVGFNITYPSNYPNTQLANRTFVYPGLQMAELDPNTNIWNVQQQPYLAADATGWGIADAAMIELNTPPVGGVRWFAGWRVVDNAAAINVNTAMGSQYDSDVYAGLTYGNSMNFFPSDIDLAGLLHPKYNPSATLDHKNSPTVAEEMRVLDDRRLAGLDNTSVALQPSTIQSLAPFDDQNVQHADVRFLSPADALWTYLGRRPNAPLSFPGTNPLAGDPLENYSRPFGDTDSGALAYHGVMADPNTPSSKFDRTFSLANTGNDPARYPAPTPAVNSDSIYRSAVNVFQDPRNRFTRFGANQVAYWFDYNFNFDFTSPANNFDFFDKPPKFSLVANWPYATGSAQLTSLPLSFSTDPKMPGQSMSGVPFRDPRHMLTAKNPVKQLARFVDPKQLPQATVQPLSPAPAAGTQAPAVMPALSTYPHKTSLNTADFAELWRAFVNVFNDFDTESGVGAAAGATGVYDLHLMRDVNKLDIHDSKGPNGNSTNPLTPKDSISNPNQFRNPLRDPRLAESLSDGVTSAANDINTARAFLDANAVIALRGALAAANVLTLRNQNGYTDQATGYFAPNVVRQWIQLGDAKNNNGGSGNAQSNLFDVYVYGVGAQPYITEVYASTDNSQQQQQGGNNNNNNGSGQQNKNGLVVVKLFNPYPFDLPLKKYELAIVDRDPAKYPNMTVQLMDHDGGSPDSQLDNQTIKKNSYLILTNYDPNSQDSNYWPPCLGAKPSPANSVVIQHLVEVFKGVDKTTIGAGGTPGITTGGELVILRPTSADPAHTLAPQQANSPDTRVAEVPVDSYDFSGLQIVAQPAQQGTKYDAWHYLRQSGDAATGGGGGGGTNVAWRWVYPGPYSGSGTGLPASTPGSTSVGAMPHYVTVTESFTAGQDTWMDPQAAGKFHFDPGANKDTGMNDGYDSATASYASSFPGIQLCNIDFGGFNKCNNNTPSNAVTFPYGGFAKVGDVVQAPFIGSYVVFPHNGARTAAPLWPPTTSQTATVTEVNPVTVDSAYVDDGDKNDDAVEQLGRFVPIVQAPAAGMYVDDLSPAGYYAVPPSNTNVTVTAGGVRPVGRRYHFALEVFNQFTTVSNPADDYLPNMNPSSWFGGNMYQQQPNKPPFPVNNTGASLQTANQGNEDGVPVEGLVNINTADWRVLAALEMIPYSLDNTGRLNAQLAKAIVHYRDVDDGQNHYGTYKWDSSNGWVADANTLLPRRGHGPFNSLWELNQVFDYNESVTPADNQQPRRVYTRTFQNAFGALPAQAGLADEATRSAWGYYVPGPKKTGTKTLQQDDWLSQTLMVQRISNLVTTRSDSFTIYVVVQGWKNAYADPAAANPTDPRPELVIEKRMAVTVDRSGVNVSNKTPKTYEFNAK